MASPAVSKTSLPDADLSNRVLRVGVLNNPFSGGNRKGLSALIKFQTAQQALHSEVQTPTEIAAALADFARREVDVVVINGGDGTVQAVLTSLFYRKPFARLPLLAILSAGTTSMIAGDVGLRGRRITALRKLFAWVHHQERPVNNIVQRPVLRMQITDQAPLFGMFFGAGAIYQGIEFCRRRIHRLGVRGELGPGLALARFLLALIGGNRDYVSPVPVTVGWNGHPPEQQERLLLLISGLEHLFLGLRPFWGTEKGSLHYTAVDAYPRQVLRALPSLLRGRPGRYGTFENGYFSHKVDEVRLVLDSGFTLDGELFPPQGLPQTVVLRKGGRASFIYL